MDKHTPGPWAVHIDKDGGNWDWQIRTVKPHNPAGEIGKHIGGLNRFIPEVEANSHLIAAAPDLLAALSKADKAIDQLCHTVNTLSNKLGLGDKVRADDFNEGIRTAIEKAKGGK